MPALQCPDCGHRAPLQAIGDAVTFRCGGCGRALKVPQQFRAPEPAEVAAALPGNGHGRGRDRAGAPAVVAGAGAPAVATRAVPTALTGHTMATPPEMTVVATRSPRGARRAALPWYGRFAVWVVALPSSLGLVFGVANALGVLSQDDLVETFTGVGWNRFVPVARLLPVAALVCAVLVQVTITYFERRRTARSAAPASAPARSGSQPVGGGS